MMSQRQRSLMAIRVEAGVVGVDFRVAREVEFKANGETEASISVLWEAGIFSVA